MTNINDKKGPKVPRISEEEELPFCPVRVCKYSRENGGGLGTYEDLLKHYEEAHANDRDGEGHNVCPYMPKYALTKTPCKLFASTRNVVDHLAYHYDVRRYPCDFKRGSCERYNPKDRNAVRCDHRAFDRSALLKHFKSEHSPSTGQEAAQRGNAAATTSSGANTQGAAMASTAVHDAPTPESTHAATPGPSSTPTTSRELDGAGDALVARHVTGPIAQASSTALTQASGRAYLPVAAPSADAFVPASNPSFTTVPALAQINVPTSAREQPLGSEAMWTMRMTLAEAQTVLASRANNASLAARVPAVPHAAVVSAPTNSSPRPAALRTPRVSRASRFAPYSSPMMRPSSIPVQMPVAQPFHSAPRSYSEPAADFVYNGPDPFIEIANLVPTQQPGRYSPVQRDLAQHAQAALAHHTSAHGASAGTAAAQEFHAGYPNRWNVAAGVGYQPDTARYAAPVSTANFAPGTYPAISASHAAPAQSLNPACNQPAPASDQDPGYQYITESIGAEPWVRLQEAYGRQHNAQAMAYAYETLQNAGFTPGSSTLMQPALQAAKHQVVPSYAPLGQDAIPRHLAAQSPGSDGGEVGFLQAQVVQAPDEFAGFAMHPASFQ